MAEDRELAWKPAILRWGLALSLLQTAMASWPIADRFADAKWVHFPFVSAISDALAPIAPVVVPVWIAGALALATGIAPRISATVALCGLGAFLIADKQNYLNHGYFFFCALVIVAVCGGASPKSPPEARRLLALALAVQMTLLYGFAALNKATVSFLSGDDLAASLHGPIYLKVLRHLPHAAALLACLAVVTEGFLAIAPWTDRIPRRWALAVCALFHLGILAIVSRSFDLVAFGLASFVCYWTALTWRSVGGWRSTPEDVTGLNSAP